jgi:predicted enzyme related to lactoylglutathione lyase
MPDRTEYAPGTPNWVDLQTSDPRAAKTFYTGLFGWEYDDQPMPGGGDPYSMATMRGRHVAAIAPLPPQQGVPPHWNTYVATPDVDGLVTRVPNAGGTVVMPPMDVMDAGRMAVIQDPTGGVIALWQAKNNIGAETVNDPNTFSWSELHTPDVAKAADFYAKVFGWEPAKFEEMDYTVFNNQGQGIGGATKPQMEGVPPNWLVYFAVDDTDATVAKAKQQGGTVLSEPMDIPDVGRFAVLADPQGAVFAIIKNAPQPA